MADELATHALKASEVLWWNQSPKELQCPEGPHDLLVRFDGGARTDEASQVRRCGAAAVIWRRPSAHRGASQWQELAAVARPLSESGQSWESELQAMRLGTMLLLAFSRTQARGWADICPAVLFAHLCL